MHSVPTAPTSREMDALTLVAQGMTNAQVAARLFLSTRTVDHRVANLLAKTGATGRAELRRLVAGWEFPQPAGHAGRIPRDLARVAGRSGNAMGSSSPELDRPGGNLGA